MCSATCAFVLALYVCLSLGTSFLEGKKVGFEGSCHGIRPMDSPIPFP